MEIAAAIFAFAAESAFGILEMTLSLVVWLTSRPKR